MPKVTEPGGSGAGAAQPGLCWTPKTVCFSSTINTLWETQLLAGKWSCPARGWFNGWHWPLEVSAEVPSLLLDVTAALCVLGSCGLQHP